MARMARVVAPGIPHYVTQRGDHRQDTVFSDDDYRGYLGVMAQWCSLCAYCLMANHVHLIVVPESVEQRSSAHGFS